MFGIFTIVTQSLDNPDFCPNDTCWKTFRDAYASGYVTMGSHTMFHRDLSDVSSKEGLQELVKSKQIIEERIGQGCVVNVLTWPYESVPTWAYSIKSIGFEIAFAGSTYSPSTNTIWRTKPEDFYQLPRVFPPNSDGISRRPSNKTLLEIMEMYTSGWD